MLICIVSDEVFVHAVLNCLLIAVYKENSTKDAICKKNIVERSSCDRVFYYSLLAALECISTMGASALQLILHSSGMIEKQHLTLLVCYQHLKMSL